MAREFDRDSDRTSTAREFDGTDDTIDLGTVADSDQSLTVMTWVKPDTVTKNFMRIITKADGNNINTDGTFFLVFDRTSGIPALQLKNNGSTFQVNAPSSVSANTYVHLAGRYDFQNGQMTLFINGQPVDSKSPGQLPPLSSQPWRIGEDNPANVPEFFNGTVDDTRIYTAALSDAEIRQIYRQTQPEQPVKPVASENLVAWYPFRRDSALDHTTLTDIPVGDRTAYDGTVDGATFEPSGGVTDIQTGANSGAFRFDGADDDIQIAHAPGLNFGAGSFSISCAVQADSLGTDDSILEKQGDNGLYQILYTKGNQLKFFIGNGNDSINVLKNIDLTTGLTRITAVRDADADELRLFAGGTSTTASTTGNFDTTNSDDLFLGFDTSTTNRLDGVLDDVRLYDTVITQSQHDEIRSNTT